MASVAAGFGPAVDPDEPPRPGDPGHVQFDAGDDIIGRLHGLQFGVFWVVGLDWVGRTAPPSLRRSSQAIFNAAAFGVAPVLALLVASVWLRYADLRSLFLALSLPALVATVCAAWIPTHQLR